MINKLIPGLELMKAGRLKQWATGIAALALPVAAFAQDADPVRWQLNMNRGVTHLSNNAYEAHMVALWVCVGIGVLVFGAMAVAMFKFRKSKGAVPDREFTHSTRLEILWTVIPVVLLVIMAAPATTKLIKMYDTRDAEMTIKVTGYQWKWGYEYVDGPAQGVQFLSNLATPRAQIVGTEPRSNTYLMEVDNELVVPVDKKVRIVVTAADVIHSWMVPDLGVKQDAVPGMTTPVWFEATTPGQYELACAELCGLGASARQLARAAPDREPDVRPRLQVVAVEENPQPPLAHRSERLTARWPHWHGVATRMPSHLPRSVEPPGTVEE